MAGLTCEFPRVIREGVCRTSHYRGHLEISHAIPNHCFVGAIRKPRHSNDPISKVKTVERELHAKLARRREISSGSLASCRDMLTSCIKRTSTRRTDTCMRKRPRSRGNETGAVLSAASAPEADHSSAALGCVMSAGTTHASNSSAVRKPSSRADSRSDRPL